MKVNSLNGIRASFEEKKTHYSIAMMERLKIFSLDEWAVKKGTGRKNTTCFLYWPFWSLKKKGKSSETLISKNCKKKAFQLFYSFFGNNIIFLFIPGLPSIQFSIINLSVCLRSKTSNIEKRKVWIPMKVVSVLNMN